MGKAAENGLEALTWVVSDEGRTTRFLDASGISANDVARRAREPEFLGFVLDFVMSDDDLAREFCSYAAISPDELLRSRRELPGGDLPHWT